MNKNIYLEFNVIIQLVVILMIDNIILDLENKLNIKIDNNKIIYYTDGATDSIVFNIDDKYLVKTMDYNTFSNQIKFLSYYNGINNLQKIVCYNEELLYICFEFINGDSFKNVVNIDVNSVVKQVYELVNSYKEFRYDGYGYLEEDHKSWIEFLKDEAIYSISRVKDVEIDTSKVDAALEVIKKYNIKKYLIHGDFGVHNFIMNKGSVYVIDLMPVVGDRLYDFYFALFSSIKIFNKLSKEKILSYFDEDYEYKEALMIVVLFIRMCRAYVYNRDDFDIYLSWYNGERDFHINRIAFIIVDNEIKYLRNSSLSHKEWCLSLGISDESYNNLVRGYIKDNEIVYYQGDFKYNDYVIKVCTDTYERVAKDNNLKDYSVYCGVIKGKIGEKWKPILKVK